MTSTDYSSCSSKICTIPSLWSSFFLELPRSPSIVGHTAIGCQLWIARSTQEEAGTVEGRATRHHESDPSLSARAQRSVVLACALTVLLALLTPAIAEAKASNLTRSMANCGVHERWVTASRSPGSTCRGVRVRPGTDLQRQIDHNPPRTTFCFAEGLYSLTSTIWTGRKFPRFDLRAGAVIDGQSRGFIGINGGSAPADLPGTVILGGVFQHFGNAGSPSSVTPVIVGRNSLVKRTEFRDNFNSGLTVQGDNARVVRVHTHHNGRYGLNVTMPCVGCPGPSGVIIEKSEIAYNNTRQLSVLDDAGGTKFVGSDGMIVRGNEVHDNYGAGLWWDGFSRHARVYNNVVYDNRNWGIFWELSYGGTKIHDNTLTGNGVGDGSQNWGQTCSCSSPPRTGAWAQASRSTRTRSTARRIHSGC